MLSRMGDEQGEGWHSPTVVSKPGGGKAKPSQGWPSWGPVPNAGDQCSLSLQLDRL